MKNLHHNGGLCDEDSSSVAFDLQREKGEGREGDTQQPESYREHDPQALADWLLSEGLSLKLVSGRLAYLDSLTGHAVAIQSVPYALRQHVETHRAEIAALLILGGGA